MDLWNEYEGKIVAQRYPLEKLLYPEGRSGFFLTSNGTGTPAVIRLTETLNDEAEMLAKWRAVSSLNEPHLVALKSCGETVVDNVPLTYAVMERPDATLAEILQERPMTAEETLQIAKSVAAALKALHSHEFAHGHLMASAVVAVDETIKLRSDCVREIADPADGPELRGRDVSEFCLVLLECLTQRRLKAGELPLLTQLPAPFEEIISNGLNGRWGLEEISRALEPAPLSVLAAVTNGGEAHAGPVEASMPEPAAAAVLAPEPELLKSEAASQPLSAKQELSEAISVRTGTFLFLAVAVPLLIVLWLVIHTIVGHVAEPPVRGSNGPVSGTTSAAAPPSSHTDSTLAPGAGLSGPAPIPTPPVSTKPWHIVAYSFRRQEEAEDKVKTLLRKHPWINAEVVESTGRSPYLVTLGGGMTREDAMAFEQKLHAERFSHAVHLQEINAK